MIAFFKKRLFWLLQILGWGGLGIVTTISAGHHENILGSVLLFSSVLLSGFVATSALRWFLKKHITFNSLSFNKIVLVSVGVLLASVLYFALSFVAGFGIGHFASDLDLPENGFNQEYQSFNFVLLLFGVILMAIWTGLYLGMKLLIRYNAARIDRLKLKDEVRQAQLNTLKGHVNPQFMADTLKEIKKLMLTDVPKSRAMLTELSELLRYSLTKYNVNAIPLGDELEMVEKYIQLISLNRKQELDTSYDIQTKLLTIEIPPMLLLSLLELTTKHGILKLDEDGTISVKADAEDSKLRVSVNSNSEIVKSPQSDFLINKIAQQLRLLYKGSADFKVDLKSFESSISILLPVTNTKEAQI